MAVNNFEGTLIYAYNGKTYYYPAIVMGVQIGNWYLSSGKPVVYTDPNNILKLFRSLSWVDGAGVIRSDVFTYPAPAPMLDPIPCQ